MKLTDISVRLGLSVSTVSRALRNAEGVDALTRNRVLAEAARVGYRRAAHQRRARNARPRTVLALSLDDSVSISRDAMAGMSRAAVEWNVSILTHQTRQNSAESILNSKLQPPAMRAGQLDGIVLMSEWPSAIVGALRQICPVVSMLYDSRECDVVAVDELEGMSMLISHLESVRPGPVGYFESRRPSTLHQRLRTAFRAARADLSAVMVEGGADAPDELSGHIRNHIRSWVCPDAVSAEYLKEAAAATGAADLSVAAFYPATPPSAYPRRWASLRIPGEDLGIASVRRLLNRIEHPGEPVRKILLRAVLDPLEPTPAPAV